MMQTVEMHGVMQIKFILTYNLPKQTTLLHIRGVFVMYHT